MGDIEFFEDVFDPEFCAFLLKDSQAKLASGHEFTRSNFQWEPNVVRASQPVLIRHYGPNMSAIILRQLAKRGVLQNEDYTVMNYAWSRLSYIPWHNDAMHDLAVTVYLNLVWEPDWGGIFLYKPDESADIRGYAPRFNTALKNSGHMMHATTMVTIDAEAPRFTIQVFPRTP